VVVAAGVAQRPGETRLQLLERNAAVFADVIPRIVYHAPDAILLIATNPVDVMTHCAAQRAAASGVPAHRVIGSGTTLDTARFRSLLGNHFGVDARHVHAYVLGEHGDSEVLTWSLATIGGQRLEEFQKLRGVPWDSSVRESIDRQVRGAAYQIIRGKGATYYGIGAALARVIDVVLHDQRSILTVCTPLDDVQGVRGVTLSLPNLVGGAGVLQTIPVPLNEQESAALKSSAEVIAAAIESLGTKLTA
jgi:L-lactate dehydrogenase